jgi:hypothetical protein
MFNVTPKRWETTFRGLADARDPQSPAFTTGRYVVEDGRAGVVKA